LRDFYLIFFEVSHYSNHSLLTSFDQVEQKYNFWPPDQGKPSPPNPTALAAARRGIPIAIAAMKIVSQLLIGSRGLGLADREIAHDEGLRFSSTSVLRSAIALQKCTLAKHDSNLEFEAKTLIDLIGTQMK